MQLEKQPWNLRINAKIKNLELKFRISKIHKFSIELKLHQLLLKVKSDQKSTIQINRQHGRSAFKSKFLRHVEKLKLRRVRKPSNFRLFPESLCVSSLVVGISTLVSQSISKKFGKEIIIRCSIVMLFMYLLDLLFRKFLKKEVNKLLLLLTAVTFACTVFYVLIYYGKCVSEYAWKVWNYAASSGFLYSFTQITEKLGLAYIS